MYESVRKPNGWLWLTFPIAILLAIAAGGGVFITGLYHRDAANLAAQAVGQDYTSLVVVLPTLIVSALLARRGSVRARLVWLGVMVYLVYTYVVAAFDVRFNALFLVYVALLGCSLYGLIGGLVTIHLVGTKSCFAEKTPVKVVSIYLAVLAILFYFMWLSEAVPATAAGAIPKSVQVNGTPTNAVHVLDMAWILPAFGITAALLWGKKALGYTLAGALLTYCVLLVLAILSMVMVMLLEGYPVAITQGLIFGVLLAIGLGMLVWYMKGLKS